MCRAQSVVSGHATLRIGSRHFSQSVFLHVKWPARNLSIREVPRSADYEYEYVWVSRIFYTFTFGSAMEILKNRALEPASSREEVIVNFFNERTNTLLHRNKMTE